MLPSALVLCLTLVPPPQQHPVHPRRLLVKLRPQAAPAAVESAHRAARGRVLRDLPQIGWQIVEVDAERLDQAREAYAAQPAVLRADFDRARPLAYDPNDPMWPGMWNLVRIRADEAWDTHAGDPSVRVAIMDTGIDETHPDLAANVWVNSGEVPGNGIDDDGNGYVDDVHGYDFAYGDSDPDDQHGHGTACAGIVAAVQDNFQGVTGIAPLCQVVAVKAALDTGYFYDSANVPALLYCADMGFQVVSMSFYSDEVTPAEKDAVEYCWANGVLLAASAGNANQVLPYYPAAYEEVMSVAATTQSDEKASFSNHGSWVDVAAPGVTVSTTTAGGGYTTSFAGTSASAPHLAGVAGLLFGAAPGATNAQVRAAIEDTAHTLVDPPYGEFSNYGLIDAYDALQRVLGLTSGSKPPRFHFAAPVGGAYAPLVVDLLTGPRPLVTVYGVGLESPNVVRVLRNGQPVPILEQTRNFVRIHPESFAPSLMQLEVNSQVVGSWHSGPDHGFVYTPSDASTQGSNDPTVTGGFEELHRDDGSLLTCTRRGGGRVFLQMIARKVEIAPATSLELSFTRHYESTNGTETIRLYDWSSGSYPYGSFVTVSTQSVASGSPQTLHVTVAQDPDDFIDDAGTVYVEVETDGVSTGGRLHVDSLRLRVR